MNKEKPRFPIIFLDADETLFDFKMSEKTALKKTLTNNGLPWDEDINNAYLIENNKIWKQFEQNTITREKLQTVRFINFFKSVDFNLNVDFLKINNEYLYNLSQCGYTMPGAHRLCSELSKYCELYITTNGIKIAQEGRLEKSGLKKYISKMFISEAVGSQKPSKEYFDYIFEDLSIKDKSKVIILGDSLSSDMQGGRNAEITTCLFDPDNKTENNNMLCDYKISKLCDFLDIAI